MTDKNVRAIVRDCGRVNWFESKIEKIISLLEFGAKLGHLFRNPPSRQRDMELGFCLSEIYLGNHQIKGSNYSPKTDY